MTELTRHLAAVMFTDVVGYTAIIAEDEKAGLAARKRHRDAQETAIAHSKGRLIQYFGDGSLSIFPSAVVGVTAAIAVQRHLHSAPSLPVRIGLHVGDIAYDEQGAYGDAVNIASRIESLVLCSQSLFRFADLGDDGLCRGGPDKGCGVIVSAIDVVVDRLD